MDTTTTKPRNRLEPGTSFSLGKPMRLEVQDKSGRKTIIATTGPFYVIAMNDDSLFVSIGSPPTLKATIPIEMIVEK